MRKLLLTTVFLSLTGCNWFKSMFGGATPSTPDRVEHLEEDGEPEEDDEDENDEPEDAPAPAPVDDEGTEEDEKVDTGIE